MKFWASAEVHQPAAAGMRRTMLCVEPFLNSAFSKSTLESIDAELRYVPIIMPAEMHGRYPARSKLKKKEKCYLCAPQLNYNIFVNGSFEEQLREYIDGIAISAPYLTGLGASQEQINEFQKIIASAVDLILLEQKSLNKTVH